MFDRGKARPTEKKGRLECCCAMTMHGEEVGWWHVWGIKVRIFMGFNARIFREFRGLSLTFWRPYSKISLCSFKNTSSFSPLFFLLIRSKEKRMQI